MSNRTQYNQPWTASVVLGAGDATKEIRAAPGVGNKLAVTRVTVTIITSAAQSLDIESSDGLVEVIKIGASPAAHVQFHYGSNVGFEFAENVAMRAQPSAVGIAALIVAEGFTRGRF